MLCLVSWHIIRTSVVGERMFLLALWIQTSSPTKWPELIRRAKKKKDVAHSPLRQWLFGPWFFLLYSLLCPTNKNLEKIAFWCAYSDLITFWLFCDHVCGNHQPLWNKFKLTLICTLTSCYWGLILSCFTLNCVLGGWMVLDFLPTHICVDVVLIFGYPIVACLCLNFMLHFHVLGVFC